jgi:hypothetical protein
MYHLFFRQPLHTMLLWRLWLLLLLLLLHAGLADAGVFFKGGSWCSLGLLGRSGAAAASRQTVMTNGCWFGCLLRHAARCPFDAKLGRSRRLRGSKMLLLLLLLLVCPASPGSSS